jgi:hypothetical protein
MAGTAERTGPFWEQPRRVLFSEFFWLSLRKIAPDCGLSGDKLQAMQQPAKKSGAPGDGPLSLGWEPGASSSFAGLLAALAAPAQKQAPAWNDDDLADDVATLSYERALQTHARYRGADRSDRSLTQAPVPQPMLFSEADLEAAAAPAPTAARQGATAVKSGMETAALRGRSPATGGNLKRSSITIRLNSAECAQLHQRAAEAGLTVSAYIRSCTFEAESLRALVKETLAQLQAAQATGKAAPSPHVSSPRFGWLGKILPYGERGPRDPRSLRA